MVWQAVEPERDTSKQASTHTRLHVTIVDGLLREQRTTPSASSQHTHTPRPGTAGLAFTAAAAHA